MVVLLGGKGMRGGEGFVPYFEGYWFLELKEGWKEKLKNKDVEEVGRLKKDEMDELYRRAVGVKVRVKGESEYENMSGEVLEIVESGVMVELKGYKKRYKVKLPMWNVEVEV